MQSKLFICKSHSKKNTITHISLQSSHKKMAAQFLIYLYYFAIISCWTYNENYMYVRIVYYIIIFGRVSVPATLQSMLRSMQKSTSLLHGRRSRTHLLLIRIIAFS